MKNIRPAPSIDIDDERWDRILKEVDSRHNYLFDTFPRLRYWEVHDHIQEAAVKMGYGQQNIMGFQQRCFMVFWAIYSGMNGGICLDIGGAGVDHPWTLDIDHYRGPEHYDYGGEYHTDLVMTGEDLGMTHQDGFQSYGFDDNVFSAILSNHSLEHMDGDTADMLRNHWLRVIKSGGYICAVIPDDTHGGARNDDDHSQFYTPITFEAQVVSKLKDVCDLISLDSFDNDFSFDVVLRKK